MKFCLGVLAAACLCTVYADGIFEAKKTSDFIVSKGLSVENGVFTFQGNMNLMSKMIQIDPAKKYKISVKYRTQGKNPSVYLGFVPYDKNRKNIPPESVNDVPGTMTELAAPVKKGDTVIFLKNASKWDAKTPHGCVVFDAKEDFSDIPNRSAASHKKGAIVKDGGTWKIELQRPVRKDYAAGTAVRQHKFAGTFIYCKVVRGSADWKEIKGTISGVLKHGVSASVFWPGTQQVFVLFMVGSGDKTTVTEFKDLELEEVK